MIRFSAFLVAGAILVLVVGVLTTSLVLVYVSIGVSVLASVLLAAGVLARWREIFGEAGAAPDSRPPTWAADSGVGAATMVGGRASDSPAERAARRGRGRFRQWQPGSAVRLGSRSRWRRTGSGRLSDDRPGEGAPGERPRPGRPGPRRPGEGPARPGPAGWVGIPGHTARDGGGPRPGRPAGARPPRRQRAQHPRVPGVRQPTAQPSEGPRPPGPDTPPPGPNTPPPRPAPATVARH